MSINKYLYIIILIFSILYSLIFTKLINYKSIYSGNEEKFECIVKDYTIDGDKLSLNLKCNEKVIGVYYIKTLEEKQYLEKNIKFGSILNINGILKKPTNNTIFNLFNYKEYLYNEKIYYLLSINTFNINNSKISLLCKIKNYFYTRASNLKNNYIYTLILGNKNYLDDEVMNIYKENGVAHLLALSGLHVCFFSMILLKLFKKFKVNELVSIIVVFIILLLFYLVSGESISLLRAILFFLIINIKKIFNINLSNINLLILLFSLIIFFNPFKIYNVGFLYSFIITFFIIRFMNNKKNYLINMINISLISYLSSLGLSIYFFGSTNLLSPLVNVLFVPLFSIVVFPLSILTFIFPFLINIFNYVVSSFEMLSIFINKYALNIYFPKSNIFLILVYYLFLYLFLRSRKVLYLSITLLSLLTIKFKWIFNSYDRFYFLEVGQGDSIIYVSNNNKSTIVIDTGGKVNYKIEDWKIKRKDSSIVKNKTIPFLRSLGINKIDYLVLTHGDFDHMGEAINLINNFKVGKVIFNCGPYNDLEQELIKVLDKKKIKYDSCIKELNIDDNKLYFLQTKEYNNENDNSNVIYTKLNGYKFMFMGDVGVEKEKDILDKYNLNNIDVLKVGHHGSKTSSSKEFINEINPKYSIISVGKNNRYGHPNKEVLNNLDKSKIYRTDQDGSIMFKIKNNRLKIETCSP